MIQQDYVIDLVPGIGVEPEVVCSQLDSDNSRTHVFSVTMMNSPYVIPAGAEALIVGCKPDKKVFAYGAADGVRIERDKVIVPHKFQMSPVAGRVKCELRLSLNGAELGSRNFKMYVEPSPIPEDADVSDSEINALIAAARVSAQHAEESANVASDYAAAANTSMTNAAAAATNAAATERRVNKTVENIDEDVQAAAASALSASNSANAAVAAATEANAAKTAAANSAGTAASEAQRAKEQADRAESLIPPEYSDLAEAVAAHTQQITALTKNKQDALMVKQGIEDGYLYNYYYEVS